jgi:pyroglutamyl-peptidase
VRRRGSRASPESRSLRGSADILGAVSKLLLTGFAPWADVKVNPSGEVAAALGGHVLPVDYRKADAALRRLLKARPSAVVMLGLGARRTAVEIELLAHNLDDDGTERRKRPIEPDGPPRRMSSLPVGHLLDLLRDAGLPARPSQDAGRFLCNHVFYVAAGLVDVPCGFIHLPPPEVVPVPDQIRGIQAVVRALGEK